MFSVVDYNSHYRHLEKIGLAFLGCRVYTKARRILTGQLKKLQTR